jgi:hypothetical protein
MSQALPLIICKQQRSKTMMLMIRMMTGKTTRQLPGNQKFYVPKLQQDALTSDSLQGKLLVSSSGGTGERELWDLHLAVFLIR